MISSQQMTPGMTISVSGKLFRVESVVKVSASKGTPFIKTKLRSLDDNQLVEKNFKTSQTVEDVALLERKLEFLYPEGKEFFFLDIGNLEIVHVPREVISDKVNYLKEGVILKASCYGNSVFSIELPQFLELMVETVEKGNHQSAETKIAILETGAKIEVPPFIDSGDIIKVDTITNDYIQRV